MNIKKAIIFAVILLPFVTIPVTAGPPYGLASRNPIGPFLNSSLPPAVTDGSGGWMTVPAFPYLTFEDPTFLTAAPGTNRLYVCCRQGNIWYFQNDPNATNKFIFLNLTGQNQGWDDCGVLGLAFHPEFGKAGSANRGYVYVYYQYTLNPINPAITTLNRGTPTYNRLSRFTVPDGSVAANPASELVLINQFDQNIEHNGGAMFFGPDGFLYLSNGDEGGSDNFYGTAQKINQGLFSGVLRIDVNQNAITSHPIRRQPLSGAAPPGGWPQSFTANYYIPNDNPFVNPNGSVLEEFYALGFRSPHRMTLDPPTGRIWLGDVGDSAREEVDLIVKGGNYQWDYQEGLNFAGPTAKPAVLIGIDTPPIYDYPHQNGDSCVIGGYVYRGALHSDLWGLYIFGDNYSGRIWSMAYDGTNAPVVNYLCNMPPGVGYSGLSSFGLDQNNELYMCQMGPLGQIWKLARSGPATAQPPALLSQLGVFTNLATLGPAAGLVPYDVNCPLWSDGAVKSRWMAVPNNASQQIGFAATGEWTFPIGTVFVKHFELATNDTNPNARKRLETRVLAHGTNGNYYGLTYKWRADNSDADLLASSLSENLIITTATGTRTQAWYYPSQQDCLICHNPNANYVLGAKTRQLNGNFTYPSSGIMDNQLRTLNSIGLFNPALNEAKIPGYASLANVTNAGASLETRVRSYIDANCAQCHRPNSGVQAAFDARFDTPLASQGITNGIVLSDLGLVGAVVVAPGDLAHSIMYLRMNTVGAYQMPPLARNTIDSNAVATMAAWITSLGAAGVTNPPVITSQPLGLTINQGANAQFNVTATGAAPLSYQWKFNGSGIGGATSSSYGIVNAQPANAGNYSVTITNSAGATNSGTATLTVNVPPTISTQPQGLTANQGASVQFTAAANGTAPLGYQWKFNGTNIAGATTTLYSIASVQPTNAGVYSVAVSNIAGSVASSNATLAVNLPPVILSSQQNLSVNQGASVQLAVATLGTAPLSYQWQFNGTNITGASASTLMLMNAQITNAGTYAVVVSNAWGSAKATNAVIAVLPATLPSPPGLIGWWPGDGNANDIQGTNNGRLVNGTTFTNGMVGMAFNFNGVTNQVNLAAINASVSNSFTMVLWAKPTAALTATAQATSGVTGLTGQRYAIFPRHGTSAFGTNHTGAGISIGNNGVSVFEHADNLLASPLVFSGTITSWVHIAVVYQNGQPQLYLNGVLKQTGLKSLFNVHPSADMGGPYGFYSGATDEVGVYNRALSTAEIQSIYNAGSQGMCKGGQITGITWQTGGGLQIGLKDRTGGNFRIDISTDLVNWTPLATITNSPGLGVFTDTSVTNAGRRFYRQVALP